MPTGGRSRTTCRRADCTSTTPCPGIILLITGAFTAVAVDVHTGWSIVAGLLVGVGHVAGARRVRPDPPPAGRVLVRRGTHLRRDGQPGRRLHGPRPGRLRPVRRRRRRDGGRRSAATVVAVAVNLLWIVVCVDQGQVQAGPVQRRSSRWSACSAPCAWPGPARAGRGAATRPTKQARAAAGPPATTRRFGPATDWISDFVAGKPSQPDPPPPSGAVVPPPRAVGR